MQNFMQSSKMSFGLGPLEAFKIAFKFGVLHPKDKIPGDGSGQPAAKVQTSYAILEASRGSNQKKEGIF